MQRIDVLQGISVGFFIAALISAIGITLFGVWLMDNFSVVGLSWFIALNELIDVLFIFALGVVLGWFLTTSRRSSS
ncbi:hypothetical protein [Vibrio rotiferianus]|uniref:hypothetical protein n=1 Tax=Vibrio rotiferianus TaxID=190895 RepID=UPI0002376B15|nr:hypothetical protein [Vibrio rotiferianus]